MLNTRFLKVVLVFWAIVVAITACSASDDKEKASALRATDGLLQYIPADTPYIFAAIEPMPQDVLDKLEPHIDVILASYKDLMDLMMGGMLGTEQGAAENAEQRKRIAAVAAEFSELLNTGGFQAAGLSLKSRFALYGVGLLPVMRIELMDVAAFEALIARFEEKSGAPMSVASIDKETYRYLGDDEARLVIAIVDNYLVVSVVPTALSSEQLAGVLGMTLPTRNIGSEGTLGLLADEYGYTSHALGFIDLERLVSTFLDDQSGVNAELLDLMDYDDSAMTDVCRKEILEMAGITPRLVTGYTEISVDAFKSNLVLEVRSDIAAGLARLAAAVPGLGMDHDGLFSFGMSIDMPAAREFYAAQLDALEADPYQCELLAELQNGVAQGRAVLNQPVPPLAYGFKGFLAVIDDIGDFDFANKQPPKDIDMQLIVAIDNAEALLAMGTMFSPDLAALNLQADGKPVEMALPQLAGQVESAHIAMTSNLLGVAVGANASDRLTKLMAASPTNPTPSMSSNMDAASYYRLMGEAMMVPDADAEESVPMPAEARKAISDVSIELGELLDRISVNMMLTERGVEIQSTVTMSD